MRVVSMKLPESLDRKLTELANRRNASRSAVIREALEALAGESGTSVTALAGSLVGSLRGPKDLSTAPGHLDGYGA